MPYIPLDEAYRLLQSQKASAANTTSPEGDQGLVGDFVDHVQSAFLRNFADTANIVGVAGSESADKLAENLYQYSEDASATLSDDARSAAEMEFLDGGYGDIDYWNQIIGGAVGSLAGTLATGGALKGALSYGARKLLGKRMAKAAAKDKEELIKKGFKPQDAEAIVAKNADKASGMLARGAYAGAGGAAVGGSSAREAEQTILQMNPEILAEQESFQENYWDAIDSGSTHVEAFEKARRDAANDAAELSASLGFVLGAGSGALTGKFLDDALLGGVAAKSVKGGAAKGALVEGLSESAEEGAQNVITNYAVREHANSEQDLTEGLTESMIQGAIGGGAAGAPLGAIGSRNADQSDARDQAIAEARARVASQGGDELDQALAGAQAESESAPVIGGSDPSPIIKTEPESTAPVVDDSFEPFQAKPILDRPKRSVDVEYDNSGAPLPFVQRSQAVDAPQRKVYSEPQNDGSGGRVVRNTETQEFMVEAGDLVFDFSTGQAIGYANDFKYTPLPEKLSARMMNGFSEKVAKSRSDEQQLENPTQEQRSLPKPQAKLPTPDQVAEVRAIDSNANVLPQGSFANKAFKDNAPPSDEVQAGEQPAGEPSVERKAFNARLAELASNSGAERDRRFSELKESLTATGIPKSVELQDLKTLRSIAKTPAIKNLIDGRISQLNEADAPKAKKLSPQERALNAKTVDVDKDDLILALRKKGGLNVSEEGYARDFGGRLKHLNTRLFGVPGIEQPQTGMNFDAAAEWAAEQGYIPYGEGGIVDASYLYDALQRSESGEKVYSTSGKALESVADERAAQLLTDDEVNSLAAAAAEADKDELVPDLPSIDAAANEAATSPNNALPEPTEAQKEAGNYKLGHIKWNGLDVSIENPKGSTRSGVSPDGKKWESKIHSHYGYVRGTEGADGDHVDVFIGDNQESEKVYVIDQANADGSFDEHKVMLGFESESAAVEGYKANYEKGWKVGPVTELSVADFKTWLDSGDTTKPLAKANEKIPETAQAGEADKPTNSPSATSGQSFDTNKNSNLAPDKESLPADPIEDFGEKLEGARKDLAKSLETELTVEEIKGSTLGKLWPKKQVDDIEDVETAAIAYAFRAEIPAKPRRKHLVERWAKQVSAVRRAAAMALSPQFQSKLREADGAVKAVMEKVDILKAIDRSQWSRIGEVYVQGINYEGSAYITVQVDSRRKIYIDEGGDIDAARRQMLEELPTELSRADEGASKSNLKFKIRYNKASGAAYIIKAGDREYRHLKEFPSVEAAREYKDNNHDALVDAWEQVKQRDNVTKADMRNQENEPRIGADRRNGKDVTPEQFQGAFGFRGVQFGNWVKQGHGHNDRQGSLNQAYDALYDLAELLNIPAKAVSLNGSLGLAFGARGKGKAAAHFEPGNLVINLTKTNGAGSLAHEWFHALDNYFSRLRGGESPIKPSALDAQKDYRQNNYITYKPEAGYVYSKRPGHPVSKAYLEKNIVRDGARKGTYADRDAWIIDPNHPEGVRPEVEEKFARLVEALNASPMKARSARNDKTTDGDGYWSRIIERGARAFENYVIAKLKQHDGKNDYLANVRGADQFQRDKSRYPYLLDEELAPVQKAFDDLFSTLKTKEQDGKTILFSQAAALPDDIATEKGFDIGKTKAVISSFMRKYKGASNVEVIVRANYKEAFGRDPDFRTKGGYDIANNRLFIFSDEVRSAEDLRATLRHELLVHHGLGMVESEVVSSLLKSLQREAETSPSLKAIWNEVQEVEGDRPGHIQAEEILARIAERKPTLSSRAWNKLMLALQRALNSIGLGVEVSAEREAKELIYQIGSAFKRGEAAPMRDIDEYLGSKVKSDDPFDAVADAWKTLADGEDVFQLPVSSQKSLEGIIAEVLPGVDSGVDKNAAGIIGADSATIITLPNRGAAWLYEQDGEVWIDVSSLKQGEDGKRIYNLAANYAINNGLLFKGDPAGLSEVARARRLENMLSSALKFGTTKHLEPHSAQLLDTDGDPKLDWRHGDDEHNLKEMLRESYKLTAKQFPEVWKISYNFDSDRFEWIENGEEITREQLGDLSQEARERVGSKDSAGSRTLERSILTASLLSRQGIAQSRPLDYSGLQRTERLKDILYNRKEKPPKGGFFNGQDKTWYHGARNNFDTIQTGRNGLVFLSESEDYANSYGDKVLAYKAAPENPVNLEEDSEARQRLIDIFNENGGWSENIDVMGGRDSSDFDPERDFIMDIVDDPNAAAAQQFMEETGHDAILFYEDGDMTGNNLVMAIADPKKLRPENDLDLTEGSDLLFSRKPKPIPEGAEQALAKAGLVVDGGGIKDAIDSIWKNKRDISSEKSNAFVTGLADVFNPLKDLSMDDYIDARLSTNTGTMTAAALAHGTPEFTPEGILQAKEGGKGLMQLLKPLGEDLEAWAGWMAGKRAEYLKARGKENNFSDNDIAELLKLGAGRESTFEAVASDWREYNAAMLEMMRDAGLLAQKQVNALKLDRYYIPFYRETDEAVGGAEPYIRSGLSGQTAPVKKMQGGRAALKDPVRNMIHNVSAAIDASVKNRALKNIIERNESNGIIVETELPASGRKDVVTVSINGERKKYQVENLGIAEALIGIRGQDPTNMMKLLGMPKRFLTTMITAEPTFMIRNMFRDTMSTHIIGKKGTNAYKSVWKGINATRVMDKDTINLMMAGGSFMGGYDFNGSSDDAAKAIRKQLKSMGYGSKETGSYLDSLPGSDAWRRWREVGEVAENANRVAYYKQMIAQGLDPRQAAFESKDVMDFSLHGKSEALRWFTASVPFLNARIQGLYKLGRVGISPEQRQEFALRGTALAAVSMLVWAANQDDERYQELPEWDKDANWHFFMGNEHLRIPKPFEIGLIYGTLPERIAQAISGKDSGKEFMGRMLWNLRHTLEIDVIPQAFKPLSEVVNNRNTFFDSHIETLADQEGFARYSFNDRTSTTMRELGDITGLSPKQLEHVWKGYTGTIGSHLLAGTDWLIRLGLGEDKPSMRTRDMPLVGWFWRGQGPAHTKYGNEFYELYEELNKARSSLKRVDADDRAAYLREHGRDIAKAKRINKVQLRLSKLRKRKEEVAKSTILTSQQKRTQIDNIQALINRIQKQTVEKLGR